VAATTSIRLIRAGVELSQVTAARVNSKIVTPAGNGRPRTCSNIAALPASSSKGYVDRNAMMFARRYWFWMARSAHRRAAAAAAAQAPSTMPVSSRTVDVVVS
jgi:hypothetical protein